MTVLSLATLGGATKSRNDPISVVPPKVAKAGIIVTVADVFTSKTLPMYTSLNDNFIAKRILRY
jgi:hypothetical protein